MYFNFLYLSRDGGGQYRSAEPQPEPLPSQKNWATLCAFRL